MRSDHLSPLRSVVDGLVESFQQQKHNKIQPKFRKGSAGVKMPLKREKQWFLHLLWLLSQCRQYQPKRCPLSSTSFYLLIYKTLHISGLQHIPIKLGWGGGIQG